jgi:hypothetical protein
MDIIYSSHILLGAFAKLRKATISFVMSVHMSVRLSVHMEQLGSHWTNFHEIWYLGIFRKCVQKFQIALKSDKNKGSFAWRPICTFYVSRSFLLRMRNVSGKKSRRESQNTCLILSSIFRNSCRLWQNVEKYCGAGHITYDNMARVHCVPET